MNTDLMNIERRKVLSVSAHSAAGTAPSLTGSLAFDHTGMYVREKGVYRYTETVPAEWMPALSSDSDDAVLYSRLRQGALELTEALTRTTGPDLLSAEASLAATSFSRKVLFDSFSTDGETDQSAWVRVSLNASIRRPSGRITSGYTEKSIPVSELMSWTEDDVSAMAQSTLRDADAKDGGDVPVSSLSSGSYPAVLSSQVTCHILMQGWRIFSENRIRSGSSPLPPLGNPTGMDLGCPGITLRDVPSHPDCAFSAFLDAEGNRVPPRDLIQKGQLVHTLGKGNIGRGMTLSGSTVIQPQIIPRILYIEPGTESLEDLLAEMGSGLLITNSSDAFHSIDLSTGDYSIPCQGVWIRSGKPEFFVPGITIAGNLLELFRRVRKTSFSLRLQEFYNHNYLYGGPDLLVESVLTGGIA